MQTSIVKNPRPHLVVWIAIGSLALASCSATRYARVPDDDDVYYSSSDVPDNASPTERVYDTPQQPAESPAAKDEYARTPDEPSKGEAVRSDTETYSDEKGNTYVTNNYYGDYNDYDADDYYDYAYAARIRRFHRHSRWHYYDPYYTNTYWYDRSPGNWGVSIYCGYRWWRPYSHTTVYVSYGDPWYYSPGYYSWYGYSPYYNPYRWSYYNGYNNGYWNGYWNGYHDGYNGHGTNPNPYYYNSRDYTSHYYGPRQTPGSNGSEVRPTNLGQMYEKLTRQDQPSPSDHIGRPANDNGGVSNKFTDKNGNVPDRNPTNIRDTKNVDNQPTATPGVQTPGNKPRDPRISKPQTEAPNKPGGETTKPGTNVGEPETRPAPDRNQYQPETRPEPNRYQESPMKPETPRDREYHMEKPVDNKPTYTQPEMEKPRDNKPQYRPDRQPERKPRVQPQRTTPTPQRQPSRTPSYDRSPSPSPSPSPAPQRPGNGGGKSRPGGSPNRPGGN
ncbi:MAG: hypothetical protein KDD36_11430 [Flavobacteriales bacterium]|nr:hypothetical protein [Flavobacteriales bacterium]